MRGAAEQGIDSLRGFLGQRGWIEEIRHFVYIGAAEFFFWSEFFFAKKA
jgi:hypothetical protein